MNKQEKNWRVKNSDIPVSLSPFFRDRPESVFRGQVEWHTSYETIECEVLLEALLLCLLSLLLILRWNCMTGPLGNSVWCRILGSFNKYTCIHLNGSIGSLGRNSHTLVCYMADVSCTVLDTHGGHRPAVPCLCICAETCIHE